MQTKDFMVTSVETNSNIISSISLGVVSCSLSLISVKNYRLKAAMTIIYTTALKKNYVDFIFLISQVSRRNCSSIAVQSVTQNFHHSLVCDK